MSLLGQILTGIFCLAIFLLGIFFNLDSEGKLKKTTKHINNLTIIGIVVVCGYAFYLILALFDENNDVSFFTGLTTLISLSIAMALLLVKTVLGPILLGASISWTFYLLFQYNEFDLVPLASLISEILLSWAPGGVQKAYAWIATISMFVGSINAVKNQEIS